MRGTIDLGAIGLFVQVAELASFRGAADALGVPRSSVSRRVAELEEQLGTRLLQRTTRKVTLTDAGAAYLKACGPSIESLREAARALTQEANEARGRLRVTAAITFGERFLGPVISEYLDSNPHVTLDLVLTDRYVDVIQEGFDLAFRAGSVRDPSLTARELGRARLRCFASEEYLHRRGTPRSPRDLADHDCVIYGPLAQGGRWSFHVNGRTANIAVRGRVTVNSLRLAVEAAQRGLGIVRLPANPAVDFTFDSGAKGKLVEVLASYGSPPSPVFAVYQSGGLAPPRLRTFLDVAMRHLETTLSRPRRA